MTKTQEQKADNNWSQIRLALDFREIDAIVSTAK